MKEELKKALNAALARKSLYIEAINEKGHDAQLLAEQQAEIVDLRREVQKWKPVPNTESHVHNKIKKLDS